MNDVTIQRNHAGVNYDPDLGLFTGLGGGMYLFQDEPIFRNVAISGNEAGFRGDGIANPVYLDGNPHVFDWPSGGNIDLGPYDLQRLPATGPRYVATDGDDTGNGDLNDCTIAADPCASISHAFEEAPTGEEIHVGPGILR